MKTMRFWATIIFILFSTQLPAQDDALIEKIGALDWKSEAGKYQLSGVNASVTISQEEWLLQGNDAHEYMHLTEGHDRFKPDAVIVRVDGPNQDTQVVYTFNEIGYVKTDDWEEHIDKDAMLREIKKGTEEANKVRAQGYTNLYIDGWAQEPYLDRENAVVYWAITGHDTNGESFVNAKALKLGRRGYTDVIWIGSPKQFSSAETSLSPTLAAYKYAEGATYADFVPGTDTVAAVGAGALAYKLITGKAAANVGAGLLAVLAIFAKKFWFIIFLPLIFVWKWLKSLFTGKKEEA
jgi:Uncharacterized membrane-anchored protein conserved in bacteria